MNMLRQYDDLTKVLVLEQFSKLPWLAHGFGTKRSHVPAGGVAELRQIHSAAVLFADRAGLTGEGDALITDSPGLALSIRTADCYPILLADSVTRSVAAAHAGWRGTAARIIPATIAKMHERFGTDPLNVTAAIGPGIGACCYEVGVEVARRFGMDRAGRIDLAGQNYRQLIECGVPSSQIAIAGRCTFCEPEAFDSWRRDRERAGRMISYVRIL